MNQKSNFKVAIVGCGRVGASIAYSIILNKTPTEIVLVDRNLDKAKGEELDLKHSLPLIDYENRILATDDFKDTKDTDLVIITAGLAQKEGETRLDLTKKNVAILEEILPEVVKASPEAKILIISNPVDVLTQRANEIVPSAGGRIFGSGTLLDTVRFRHYLAQKIFVSPKSIHAYILGEHGESSFPVYAAATVGGQKLLDFSGVDEETIKEAYLSTKNAAAEIIAKKGATYYAIGVVATKIIEAIFSDTKTIYPLSVPLMDYYGHSGVCLSVPCVLGRNGIERVLKIELSKEEQENLSKSVKAVSSFGSNL